MFKAHQRMYRQLGISLIHGHAVVRYMQLILGIHVSEDYELTDEDRWLVEPLILEGIRSAKKLTTQQALVLVKCRTRVTASAQRAMGTRDFQTEGAESFFGTYYDDGRTCFVVEKGFVRTILIPDLYQRQAMEDILEQASLPPLKLVSSAPEPAPFELCLLEKKLVGDQLTSSHEQLRWWMNRFKRTPGRNVRILRSSAYSSNHLRMIHDVIQSLDVRSHVIQKRLPLWDLEINPEARKIWRDCLRPSSQTFSHTIVMCAKPMELLLSLASLMDERSPLTEEEAALPRGLVYAVDPEILAARKHSSFWMLK